MKLTEIVNIFDNLRNKYDIDGFGRGISEDISIEDFENSFGSEKEFLKEKNNYLTKLKNLFIYPTIVLHESMHFLFGFLLFMKPNKIYIGNPFGNFDAYVKQNGNNKITRIITSLSPIMIVFLAIILPFLNLYFLVFSIYVLLTITYVIPSSYDVLTSYIYIKYFNKYTVVELSLLSNIVLKRLSLREIIKEDLIN